jgi:hypothetical protein
MSQVDNPKHAAGLSKPPVRHIPPIAIKLEGAVMQTGGDKYGPFNWGEAGVVASTYYDAIQRHLLAWYAGENLDPESGLHHLAHVRACCGIVLDCVGMDNVEDDRPRGKTTRLDARVPGLCEAPAKPIRRVAVDTFSEEWQASLYEASPSPGNFEPTVRASRGAARFGAVTAAVDGGGGVEIK